MVKDNRHRTRALVTPQGHEISISAIPAVFSLIGTIQEETHRFAITYHHTLRSRRVRGSKLEEIPWHRAEAARDAAQDIQVDARH